VLRQGGVFAAFWNVQHPPAPLAEAFNALYARIAPGSPFANQGRGSHTRILDRAYRGLVDATMFDTPRVRRFPWERTYTGEQWLELVSTFGGHARFTDEQLDELTTGLSSAIDAVGGAFTMDYETLLLTAART
jgi:hypothetical protein